MIIPNLTLCCFEVRDEGRVHIMYINTVQGDLGLFSPLPASCFGKYVASWVGVLQVSVALCDLQEEVQTPGEAFKVIPRINCTVSTQNHILNLTILCILVNHVLYLEDHLPKIIAIFQGPTEISSPGGSQIFPWLPRLPPMEKVPPPCCCLKLC